ncbi:CCA tRNA nucleotidyltransferase [Alsobacter sp. R-9]
MTGPAQARLPAGCFIARADLQALLAVLDRDGEEARVVGGAVRNALLGLEPGDIDVATTALPKEVMRRARAAGLKPVPTGLEHGTITVVVEGTPFEVTTLREDVDTDGRRATVVFGREFSHDARRRDFTINALYATADGTVTDTVGGLADLAARRVRFIGDAETRIREDYLRILRLFRFHAEYGEGPLDDAALTAAIRLRAGLGILSAERVRAEVMKLLMCRRAAETLEEVAETGFADRILGGAPDVRAFARLVDTQPGADATLRLAALAIRIPEDADRLRERLRLSNAEHQRLERIGTLLGRLHGRLPVPDDALLRRLSFHEGAATTRDALAVAAARHGVDPRTVLAQADRPLREGGRPSPFRGPDLVKRGVQPGPRMGAILLRAQDAWLDAGCPDAPAALAALLDAAVAALPAEAP